MALRDQPYLPLYVQDYLTDEKLNACCAATQGVYIKIMCILHKSDKYGKLLLKQKDKQNESKIKNFAYKLTKLLPFTNEEIESALTELIEECVMIIEGDTLFQKRMVKDGELSEKRALAASCSGSKKSKIGANDIAKDLAKSEQNTEYENEIEDDIENDIESEKENLQIQRFNEFWNAYPKKVGRGAALKSWNKIKPSSKRFAKIISAVEAAKKSKQWLKDDGQYIPNPATWLNQGRWDDELEGVQTNGGNRQNNGSDNGSFHLTGFKE
ncbi:MAG: hypothetical protein K0R50_432 [Eubacterium sp.]|nr:hypothetical protein [Eubacterium sp.]